jgi:hypothetical protein
MILRGGRHLEPYMAGPARFTDCRIGSLRRPDHRLVNVCGGLDSPIDTAKRRDAVN